VSDESAFPEGINFHFTNPSGELAEVKVLSDSGAGISCVSGLWVKKMGYPITKGENLSITGVTKGRLSTNEYVRLVVTSPLRPEINVELKLVVLPDMGEWKCKIPACPKGLRKYKMYLADEDILQSNKVLTYPILVSGKYMSIFKMTAVYFNNSFALVDSIAGLIPRGTWPRDCPTENLRGFSYEMSYNVLIGAVEEEEMIKIQITGEKPEKNPEVPGIAATMEDLELNHEIMEALRRELIELDGVTSSEVKLTVRERFEEYLKSVRVEDDRIILPLPKSKGFPHKVRANHRYGEIRGRHLRKYLDESPYAPIYIRQVEQWIEQGKLVKTTLEELAEKSVEYSELTHHAVLQPGKPNFPIRVVINGNSKEPGGYSPNDWLDPGANLLPLIPSIIFYIRNKRYYMSADISKAFLQIKLDGDDAYRIILRWPKKDAEGKWYDEFYRFAFLPWGIRCASFCLAAGLKFVIRQAAARYPEYAKILQEISNNNYADDLNAGANTLPELYIMYSIMEDTAKRASMPLGKYKLDPASLAKGFNLEPSYKPYKILGCGFDPETSSFYVPLARLFEFLDKPRITKRQAWGLVARFYDVLGICIGCQLLLKILRQEIDNKHPKAPWGFLLSKRETAKWHAAIEEFRPLVNLKVPRYIACEGEYKRMYMLATDASKDAIGAAAHVVSLSLSGRPLVSFLMAKTKLLPSQQRKTIKEGAKPNVLVHNKLDKHPVAINRLELQAAVLGAKMMDLMRSQFTPESEIYGWTDSINVARWLKRGPITGTVLLDKKIQMVYDYLPGAIWQYIPGTENPADLCTRPQTAAQLLASPVWRQGPDWYQDKTKWPAQPEELSTIQGYADYLEEKEKNESKYLEEVKSMLTPEGTTQVLAVGAKPPAKIRHYDEPLTDILFRDKESWEKVVISYAAVLRWRAKLSTRAAKWPNARSVTGNSHEILSSLQKKSGGASSRSPRLGISVVEFYNAEMKLIRLMQMKYEPKLFDTLRKNPGMISEGLTWSPELELIVSRSRHAVTRQERKTGFGKDLIHIPLSYTHNGTKYLNRVAELLMIQAHELSGHAAAKGTLATFRVRFWVSKGTALAKWAKKRCGSCRRMDARVVTAPPPPLPAFRSHERMPFEATGMDFLGPLQKLHDTGEKTYILVLTCAYTRAVILRPILSESAQAFVTAFNTIRHEWGIEPVEIISDKGSGFTSAFDKTIRNAQNLLEQQFPRITWNFNASRAPWWGGFFERFMFIIKDRLARCFNSHYGVFENFAQFTEAVAYVMSVINSRPLTWMSEDPDENRHPICPQIFLNFNSKYNFLKENPYHYGPHAVDYMAASSASLRDAFRTRVAAYNSLFTMFKENYVAELRKFQNQKGKPTDQKLKIGMVVLFRVRGLFRKDQAGDRRKWRLARIVKLHSSPKDGRVRSVDLDIFDSETQKLKTHESQSIANIAILEADDEGLPAWLVRQRHNYGNLPETDVEMKELGT
jgi:hypothetical protein